MGRDKALLKLPGSGLLLWQRQLAVLEELHPETLFWSGPTRPDVPAHVRVIEDKVIRSGPLGGISACLDVMPSDLLLVLAIDLPEMTSAFLGKLLASSSADCGAVGAHDSLVEPLAAVYPRRLRSLASEHLHAGRRAMKDLIAEAGKLQAMSKISLTGSEVSLFRNVNSPRDLNP
jgi:molybdopterin-guanine dinucleotide biosynthesis protein A